MYVFIVGGMRPKPNGSLEYIIFDFLVVVMFMILMFSAISLILKSDYFYKQEGSAYDLATGIALCLPLKSLKEVILNSSNQKIQYLFIFLPERI